LRGAIQQKFITSVHLKSGQIKEVAFSERGLIIEELLYFKTDMLN
jgi:hypothetical protein